MVCVCVCGLGDGGRADYLSFIAALGDLPLPWAEGEVSVAQTPRLKIPQSPSKRSLAVTQTTLAS